MKHSNIFILLVVALCGLSLVACSDGDDLNTDQYGNEIALNSFGPSPVLRGGTLYFYGSNLDQITEVDIPGADPITAIEVIASGKHSRISVQVPAEKCDTGIVSLVTAKGGRLQTITPITYREDISLKEVYVGNQGNLVGNVGDVVTITGDYLNLMHGVIFADNDTVKEEAFVAHDRYTIQVAIPEAAKSGKLILTDLAESPTELETEEAITVNLPTVTSFSPATPKAGQTISVEGKDLDQISTVKLSGTIVETADFLSQTATALSFALPAVAGDGEITLVTKSGVEISAGSITTVVPTDLKTAPAPVKNLAEVTISGKDLDLVTGISFPNAGAGTLKSVATTKVVAVVPETAQDGNVELSLANGKTVTVAYTLVKPTVTACVPATIVAGNRAIIRGTDLDLVASVTFPGDTPQTVSEFSAHTASAIGVTIPGAAVGSGLKLTLKNGTTVDASGLTIQAATDPTIEKDAEGVVGDYVTVTGKNFNNVEAVYIGETKVTKISSRSNTSVSFQIPESVSPATYNLVFVGADGSKYTVGKIKVNSKDIVLNTACVDLNSGDRTGLFVFPVHMSWDDSGRFGIQRGMSPALESYDLVAGRSKIVFEKTGTGQIQFNNGNWGSFMTISDWSGSETQLEVVLTQDMIDWAKGNQSDGWSNTAFICQGDGLTVTRILLVP